MVYLQWKNIIPNGKTIYYDKTFLPNGKTLSTMVKLHS